MDLKKGNHSPEIGNGDKSGPKKSEKREFDEYFKSHPVEEETKCGYSFLTGATMQVFANKKTYIFFYGIAGCMITAGYAYFNGIVSTIEKRFKIPSRNTGIISTGNDVSQFLVSIFVTYYVGNRHKPRWMAFGVLLNAIYCFCTALPHFIYGGGSDSLSLTREYGAMDQSNITLALIEKENRKVLCHLNATSSAECDISEGNLAPQILLFVAQFSAGIGNTLYSSLGVAYMDDNVKKSKAPVLISVSWFIKMLGPAMGYSLASLSLKLFISPWLSPTITTEDPRWLGAWWIGWIILGAGLTINAFFISLFPKELPRSAARRKFLSREPSLSPKEIELQELNREKEENLEKLLESEEKDEDVVPTSISDMWATLKRLFKNKILMLNNLAGVFYLFGFLPYWVFMPKYIESQYRMSASSANLYSGTVGLVFTALGILASGVVVSKYKPTARQMAAWNVLTGLVTGLILLSYISLGCDENDNAMFVSSLQNTSVGIQECNLNCHCDFVKYSPVCGEDGNSYISACHAGCTERTVVNQTSKSVVYEDCSCVQPNSNVSDLGGTASPGACPIDCMRSFFTFLAAKCFLNLVSSSGIATNFLVAVRCVDPKDKTISMGIGMAFTALFAFIPSPVFFGILIDSTCLVWGKTCSGTGNCWLYDGPLLRSLLNRVSSSLMFVAVLFDCGVWYYVKDLKIFDESSKAKIVENEDKIDKSTT